MKSRFTKWLVALMLVGVVTQAHSGLWPAFIPTNITLAPVSLTGGQSSTGTVTLDGAPTVDQTVQITTNHPEVFSSLPSSVVVAAGTTSQSFQIQTNTVTSNVTATITGSCNGGSAQGNLLVKAPPQ